MQFSSWGKSDIELDAQTLANYNQLLKKTALVGETLSWVLGLLTTAFFLYQFAYGNFENVLLVDGTAKSCLYDGETERVLPNE